MSGRISEDPDAGVLTGSELVPVVIGGLNKRTTTSQIPGSGTFTQSGAGAVPRTISSKLKDTVSVKDFGAVGDGVTDDSAAFTAALASSTLVICSAASYVVHDVTIPNGVTLLAYGAYFKDKAGASYIFKLTGYGTSLLGAYISTATNCATAAIVVDDGQYQTIRDVDIINTTTGIKMQSSSNGSNGFGNSKAFLDCITINNFSGTGVYFGPNVHDADLNSVYCDANTVAGGGGQIPKTGTVGFAFVGTGTVVATGGNQGVNLTAINCQTAYQFTDAQLDAFSNVIADSCSGIGINLTGSTTNMLFNNVAIGACAAGVVSNGSAGSNQFTGLRTNNTGVIPPWGGTTYYSSAGFSAPFYDLQQIGTGSINVDADNWRASGANAHSFTEAVAGSIQLLGGIILPINSNGTVAANSTVFLGLNGQNATETNVVWVEPQQNCYFIVNAARVVIQNDVAPGAGQSFTYTVRVNQADTAVTGTTTGAGVFQATMSGGPISLGPANKMISIKLVTSATAGVARHRGYIQLIPQPN